VRVIQAASRRTLHTTFTLAGAFAAAAVIAAACGEDATVDAALADEFLAALDFPGGSLRAGAAPAPSSGPDVVLVQGSATVAPGGAAIFQVTTNAGALAEVAGVTIAIDGATQFVDITATPGWAPVSSPGPVDVWLVGPFTGGSSLAGERFTLQFGAVDANGNAGASQSFTVTVANADAAPVECPAAADCSGLACGPDPVCGTSCGDCATGEACTFAGQCEAAQTAGGGTTTTGATTGADCPADADCSGRECGPDPVCGTACGTCASGDVCNFAGLCEPDMGTTSTGTTGGTTDTGGTATAGTDTTTGGAACGQDATVCVTATVAAGDDPCGHEPFISLPSPADLTLAFDGTAVGIGGPGDPWVAATGTIAGCQIPDASGTGTIAGFQGVACSYLLDFDAGGAFTGGEYVCGTQGELPGGCPIVYTLAPC
jgi:hypothetical protein